MVLLISFMLFGSALAQNSCYYAANKRAGSAFVPCDSNSASSACCQLGDLCLSDSACWNPEYNVTYLYGCTDSTYSDVSCPWKCGATFASDQWVGLDYCVNTTRNEWACTHPPTGADSIQPNAAQQCVDDSIVAFAGPSSLQPILSLPTNVGGSVLYFSEVNPTSYTPVTGYTPTTTVRATASVPTVAEPVSPSSTSTPEVISIVTTTAIISATSDTITTSSTSEFITSGQSTSTTSSASTSTTSLAALITPSSTPDSGMSTGAKAGIGAGIGIAVLAVIAAVIAWTAIRKKRSRRAAKGSSSSSSRSRPAYMYSAVGQSEKNSGLDNKGRAYHSELPVIEKMGSPNAPSELSPGEDGSSWGTPAPTYAPSPSLPQRSQGPHELWG